MARRKSLSTYDWHEARDRAFLASDWFEEFVAAHPAVVQTPKLRKTAEELAMQLGLFYQAVSAADPTLSRRKK